MGLQITSAREAFEAAEPCAVEWTLRLDRRLTPADCIRFQFPNSWSIVQGPTYTRAFQSSDPSGAHYLSVSAPGGEAVVFEIGIERKPLVSTAGYARHARLISARLAGGTVPAGTPIRLAYENTFAPYVADREEVWIRVNEEAPAAVPVLTVRGGTHDHLRVLVPSAARPGDPFDVLIVSLDRFDNVSSTRFDGERLSVSGGGVVAERLGFRGSLRVACRMDGPGVFRFRFRDTLSNAIRIGESVRGPRWGDLHIHSRLSHDAMGVDPYGYAHEVSGLDFAAVTDHWESLGPDGYRTLSQRAEQANAPGTFVTLHADERNSKELTGHHNVYFRGAGIPPHHQAVREEGDAGPASGFARLQGAAPSEVMVIPHHTGIDWGGLPCPGIGSAVNWEACDDRGLRPVMEIYSHHGQSELYAPAHVLAYELNRMRNPERRANTSVPGPYYAQDYWMRGKRIGVIGSSDEHSGQGGRRHGGLAAVFAEELTRGGIFDALRRRHCYATTGERILMEFTVDGLEMGMAGHRAHGARLPIRLNVWGTEKLLRVDVLRYRFGVDTSLVPFFSTAPRPETYEATLSLEDTVGGACLYYVRVMQAPVDWPGMAWTSPIWIDVEEPVGETHTNVTTGGSAST